MKFAQLLAPIFFLLACLTPHLASASHLKGVEIYYDYIGAIASGAYVYRIHVVLYSDCSGHAYAGISNFDINSFIIRSQGACGTPQPYNGSAWMNHPVGIPLSFPPQNYTTQAWPQGSGNIVVAQDVAEYCHPNTITSCDNPGTGSLADLPGISKHIWSRDYLFVGTLCDEYILRFTTCCRNISTGSQLVGGGTGSVCVETIMRHVELGNSSPRWLMKPPPIMYNQSLHAFSLNPFDPDSDSISYSLAPVYGDTNGLTFPYTVYTQGASFQNPIPSLVPFAISAQGDISVLPNANVGDYAATFAITETRMLNGVPTVTSIVHREIVFTLLPPLSPITMPGVAVFSPCLPFIDSVAYSITNGSQGAVYFNVTQAYALPVIEITCEVGQDINANFMLNDTGYIVLTAGDTLRDSVTAHVDFPASVVGASFNAPIFNVPPIVNTQFLWTPDSAGVYEFTVESKNNICPINFRNSQLVRIIVTDTTLVTANRERMPSLLNLRLVPNPATDVVKVHCTGTVYQIDVIDETGRIIRTEAHPAAPTPQTPIALNVAALPAGVYVVLAHTHLGPTYAKFVVHKN